MPLVGTNFDNRALHPVKDLIRQVTSCHCLCYIYTLCVFIQVNVNLAGLPSLVVPCGFVEGGASGLPVGLQMISSSFSEVV